MIHSSISLNMGKITKGYWAATGALTEDAMKF